MTTEKATFAGGCFWCMEPPYSDLDGVISVYPGYTGGNKQTQPMSRLRWADDTFRSHSN